MVKNLLANAEELRDAGPIPGLGRFPGGGNGNRLQYSCLENSTDKGTERASVLGVAKSQTQLSTHIHTSALLVCEQGFCSLDQNSKNDWETLNLP